MAILLNPLEVRARMSNYIPYNSMYVIITYPYRNQCSLKGVYDMAYVIVSDEIDLWSKRQRIKTLHLHAYQ